jgi:hypothetical protein
MTTTLNTTPPIHDMTLYRGDTQPRTFKYRNRATGELQSLAGATALMQLRSSASSETVIYTFPLTVNEAENTITMLISNWELVTWTTGVYDLEVTYGSGVVETWIKGTCTVMEDVSRE